MKKDIICIAITAVMVVAVLACCKPSYVAFNFSPNDFYSAINEHPVAWDEETVQTALETFNGIHETYAHGHKGGSMGVIFRRNHLIKEEVDSFYFDDDRVYHKHRENFFGRGYTEYKDTFKTDTSVLQDLLSNP